MTTKEEFNRLRERAIELRRTGKSRREIKQILGITANSTLTDILRGEPPQPWTRRPNAKDDLRERARELRLHGLDYAEIAGALHVSKSSVSLWVRDLPRPEHLSIEQCRKRGAEASRRYWEAERSIRAVKWADISAEAAAEISTLSDRELLIAGAIAYWCEGSKNKPYRQQNRAIFTNSDPALISLYLRFLKAAGVSPQDLIFRVCIHESADVQAAQLYWLELSGAHPEQFRSPTLKRHNPKTVRKNTGSDYRGCLRIEVRRGSELYRKIEGWAAAAMGAMVGTIEAQALPARF
jgi:transcriptional regulator with XRE-family HTH domain